MTPINNNQNSGPEAQLSAGVSSPQLPAIAQKRPSGCALIFPVIVNEPGFISSGSSVSSDNSDKMMQPKRPRITEKKIDLTNDARIWTSIIGRSEKIV